MKRFLILLFSLTCLSFISCGTLNSAKNQQNIDYVIASNLQSMDNNFSDETLKALSVVLRNNIIVKQSYSSSTKPNDKYLKIVKSTKNKMLKDKNNDIIEITFNDTNSYEWQKNIKKSEILEFALKNNLSLSSLSDIKPVIEDEKVIGLNIGKKYFDYSTLAKHFNLNSNNIKDIQSNKSEVIIKGHGNGFYNHFDILKSEELSNNNHNFEEILEYFFNDLTLG